MWRCSRASRITAGARKVNAKGGAVKGGAIGAKGEAIFDAAIHRGLPRSRGEPLPFRYTAPAAISWPTAGARHLAPRRPRRPKP